MNEALIKIGDVVLYTAFGRSLNAIVFGIHKGDVSREGANSEPILDLFYIDVDRESEIARKKIGWEPSVVKDYGVVHASHEFSAEHKQAHGLHTPHQLATARGQGEWSEFSSGYRETLRLLGQRQEENLALQAELAALKASLDGDQNDNPDPQE